MIVMLEREVKITSKLMKVPLRELHVQYIPYLTPIRLWGYNMNLVNSPHVELLLTIKQVGLDWEHLKSTRYWKERKRRFKLGNKKWTDKHLKKHITWRYEIYKSLKKKGFKRKLYKDKPILILKEPFWTTRFGYKRGWLIGPEIYDGAGRCSAAIVLGWKEIPAMWCEDIDPGSNNKGLFEKKLANIEGVWEATLSA